MIREYIIPAVIGLSNLFASSAFAEQPPPLTGVLAEICAYDQGRVQEDRNMLALASDAFARSTVSAEREALQGYIDRAQDNIAEVMSRSPVGCFEINASQPLQEPK